MPFDVPNIVPENNLRLPDALTIKHGPAPLLGRFVVAADRATRRRGITCGCGTISKRCSISIAITWRATCGIR